MNFIHKSLQQELIQNKEEGFMFVNKAVESGEKLYPNTSADGREAIRQQLRNLKLDWDTLYDDVLNSQRHLEVNLVQWTSFEESYEQLENWLKNIETQLAGDLPLHSLLEEKKGQLQTYKVKGRICDYYKYNLCFLI